MSALASPRDCEVSVATTCPLDYTLVIELAVFHSDRDRVRTCDPQRVVLVLFQLSYSIMG